MRGGPVGSRSDGAVLIAVLDHLVEGGFHFLSLTNADAVTPRLRTFLQGVS